MAIIYDGILGATHGRIGPVTAYRRNGRNILRTARNNGVVKSTAARLAQREKIKLCNDFTQAFTGTGFFNKTFPAYGHTGSGYNRVTSCLLNLAIAGNFPGQKLSWDKVLIARGPLPVAENGTATPATGGKIIFSWTDNSGNGTAKGSDTTVIVAYCPELRRAAFSFDSGTRDTCTAMLDADIFESRSVATWLAFLNQHGDVSDSVFTGVVDL